MKACRHSQEIQLFLIPNVIMEKKCDFDHEMIADARQGGLSISETADLQGFSHITVSRVCREWCKKKLKNISEQQFCEQKCLANERGQRIRARLVEAERKVTILQITTHSTTVVCRRASLNTQCVKPLNG